jgi:anti-sigma B factor antagonist
MLSICIRFEEDLAMGDHVTGIFGPRAAGASSHTHSPARPVSCPGVVAQDSTLKLAISVAPGRSGPVVKLSGEADLTTLAQLKSTLTQIPTGARLLTVDLSELRFADSAAIATLVRTARTLRERGAQLELMHPQPAVARILSLTGVDQALTVHRQAAP